jgi:methylamine---glutamate N-methyltransferase subunit A
MCGIVGLFLKDPALEPSLGAMLGGMLATLSDRGPDSAGYALYNRTAADAIKITIRGPRGADFAVIARRLYDDGGIVPCRVHDTHLVLTVPLAAEAAVRAKIAEMPDLTIVGVGRCMEIFKEVGRPEVVAERFGLDAMPGTHGIGHSRMATESAVTTDGSHPFTTGADQCLVHNGSLSNHNGLRRELTRQGLSFRTDNDTEVAAAYMSWRIREGDSLEQTLNSSLGALDGFYTFVFGTESGFGVLRDPIACKPAVMAETDRWVAFGSEYRALVGLPGIDGADVWEPVPAKTYLWERH